ncbi:CAP domain-containing protein [Flavobacterium sp.]|uniref:CAP domain-containing protein n=1 Tax=Flavobacterium sp. TaxID=239 RepID=UPI0037A06F41
MKAKLLCVLLLVAMTTTMISCSPEALNSVSTTNVSSTTKIAEYTYNTSEIETMALINDYRVSIGLKALKDINYISVKAEEHNNDMIAVNTISHDGFVARSADIMKVLGAVNVGENVAFNYATSQAAFTAWLNSPGHKANIEGDYTNFGMSIRLDSAGRKYYTNIFVKI